MGFSGFAINASNGHFIWKHQTGDSVNGTPAVSNGLVYVASGDNTLYALHTSNGSTAWKVAKSGGFGLGRGWPVITQGIVFIGAGDGNLYAFNASNGGKVWSFAAGDSVSSPTIGQ